jgi:hypothetical protein
MTRPCVRLLEAMANDMAGTPVLRAASPRAAVGLSSHPTRESRPPTLRPFPGRVYRRRASCPSAEDYTTLLGTADSRPALPAQGGWWWVPDIVPTKGSISNPPGEGKGQAPQGRVLGHPECIGGMHGSHTPPQWPRQDPSLLHMVCVLPGQYGPWPLTDREPGRRSVIHGRRSPRWARSGRFIPSS